MKINRFPNGFLEYDNARITLSGDPATILPIADIISILCRDGRKTIFSRNPPYVVEITFQAGISNHKTKLLIRKEEKENMLALIVRLESDRNAN
jgi:hypothetical protein